MRSKIDIDEITSHGRFATILKCMLVKKHITQGKLASATGLSEATITHYMKGRNTPSLSNLEKIANFLNVPPKIFYDDIEKHTPYLYTVKLNFGRKLSAQMKKKHILQSDLSAVIGVSRQTVSYYATGKQLPNNEVLEKIADYFGVPTSYYFDDEEQTQLNDELESLNDIFGGEE